MTHPDTVEVTVRPTSLGETSVVLVYEVRSRKQQDAVVATGEAVVVFVDFVSGKKHQLPADVRARIEAELKRAD